MTTLTVGELEANLRAILERVRAGERVVIESDGAPVAQLSPCDPLAELLRALPGVQMPTKHMRDIHFERIPIAPGVDVFEVLREVRDDRDLLP